MIPVIMATPSNNPSCFFIHTLLSDSSIAPTVKAFSTVVSDLGEINIGVADIMANAELFKCSCLNPRNTPTVFIIQGLLISNIIHAKGKASLYYTYNISKFYKST